MRGSATAMGPSEEGLARPLTGWEMRGTGECSGLRGLRADTHGRRSRLLRANALGAHPARCCWRCGIERGFVRGLRVPFCAAGRRQPAIGRELDHRGGALREVEGGLSSGSVDASQLSTSVL